MLEINLDWYTVFVIYSSVGLFYNGANAYLNHRMNVKINGITNEYLSDGIAVIMIKAIGWPILCLLRMVKYAEMKQTLKFIENKIKNHIEDQND